MAASCIRTASRNFWVITVSKEHVMTGVKLGIVQACHGKKAPLKKMKPGDGIVHYSPKKNFRGTGKANSYQKFTAVGTVEDGEIYQVEMAPGFRPFRRDVRFEEGLKDIPIHDLLSSLEFTAPLGKKWGMAFRYGVKKISEVDYELIRTAMRIEQVGTKPEDS